MDRTPLQERLEDILGMRHVYFDPPSNLKMQYPAITYKISDYYKKNADNKKYLGFVEYELTVISDDPDNVIGSNLMTLFNWCSFGRRYQSDNLYHDTFTLYY